MGVSADGPAHLFCLEYQNKKRKTRREVFLEQLDSLIG